MRIGVTTDRFEQAAAAFSGTGLKPVSLPCIRVRPASESLLVTVREAAGQADLLMISSARVVGLLWPDDGMPPLEVAVVGETTAAEVDARGGKVVATGRGGLAELVGLVIGRWPTARVVFPHAADSDPAALQALRRGVAHLAAIPVYSTVPVAPGPAQVEGAAFASPSAVWGWMLSRTLEGLVVGVIGATTQEAVARHRPPDVVAPRPSYRELARALASYMGVPA